MARKFKASATMCEAKNVGRANATTADRTGRFVRHKAKWDKKVKLGYTTDVKQD
jgi:hypothetical protein